MYDFYVQPVDAVSNFATPRKLLRKFSQTGPVEEVNLSTFLYSGKETQLK